MLLKYFYDEQLAQASYLAGCPAAGEALIIDPARDITPYLEMADRQGLRITAVTETHIHADYVSGTRELAAATGATIYLSAMGPDSWQYQFEDSFTPLHSADTIQVGSIKLEVLHTPGHTPEHIAFLMTDTANADEPIGIFSGDFIFAGDVGRPDLLEVAAGMQGTADTGARQQFQSIQTIRQYADYLQVWPGHGAGSACGKAPGAIPSTTLGYERRFNPAFQLDDENTFVDWLLSDQPEAPRYFARMKIVNRQGPDLLRSIPQAQHITDSPAGIVPEDALFIDTRPPGAYSVRHFSTTINIPVQSSDFCTYVGWYVDYEKPVFFIAYQNDVMTVLNALLSIGVDDIPGYFTAEVLADATATLSIITPQQAQQDNMTLLDVRNQSEYNSLRIPGAIHIPMGDIPAQVDSLPRDEPLAVFCETGIRSQIVASLLKSYGFEQVATINGGIVAWSTAGLTIDES